MPSPTISVIIPAYNEARYIQATLASIHTAFPQSNLGAYEIIVADDASTDETARLAQESGAVVVHSGKRNIGATRNVGARHASGNYLLFVDADTQINARTLDQMGAAIQQGYIGGGAIVRWDKPVSKPGEWGVRVWNQISRLFHMPAGSFFFVNKAVFDQVGGFDEEFFICEELTLGKKLKKQGRLKILSHPIHTSARKLEDYSLQYHLKFVFQVLVSPSRLPKTKEKLGMWYQHR
jgi:glycosyltransferase involved in cell wall biosynthesis